MTEVEMAKNFHLQMRKILDIWSGKLFFHLDRESSIKTKLQTCKSKTGQSISYRSVHCFQLNLPHPNFKKSSSSNSKTFSHFQMDIFYHIDFCHSRRNGFSIRRCSSTRSLQYLMPFFSYDSLVAVATAFTPADTNQTLKCVLNRKSKF